MAAAARLRLRLGRRRGAPAPSGAPWAAGAARRRLSNVNTVAFAAAIDALSSKAGPAAARAAADGLAQVTRARAAPGAQDGRFYARLLGNASGLADAWIGRNGSAARILDEAFRESSVGTNHDAYLDLGGLLNDLAVCRAQAPGGASEAAASEAKLKRALFMAERAYKADGDLVAATLTNLGELCFWCGDAARGAEYHLRALRQLDMNHLVGPAGAAAGGERGPVQGALEQLRLARIFTSRGAAGRALLIVGGEGSERGEELVLSALKRALEELGEASGLRHIVLSSIYRDAALLGLASKATPDCERYPEMLAAQALRSALAAAAPDALAAAGGAERSALRRLAGESHRALEAHCVVESCAVYALSLRPRDAVAFVDGGGALRERVPALERVRSTAAALSGDDERRCAEMEVPVSVANAEALRQSADAAATGAEGTVRERFIDVVTGGDKRFRGAGALGVGLRDCFPSDVQWHGPSGDLGVGVGDDGRDARDGGAAGGGAQRSSGFRGGGFDPFAL